MSRVELIEGQVRSLTEDELQAFRVWFVEFEEEIWDAKIEADARNGRLGKLAERALRDHENGLSKPL